MYSLLSLIVTVTGWGVHLNYFAVLWEGQGGGLEATAVTTSNPQT